MQQRDIERLIRLAQKTGDTLIIAGQNDDNSVVLMPVEKYEALMDVVTESGEMNYEEDISEVDQEFEDSMIPDLPVEEVQAPSEAAVPNSTPSDDDFGIEEERFYLEPVE